jgi:peptidoglycan/LPS O-acetylase OafA/YrhL
MRKCFALSARGFPQGPTGSDLVLNIPPAEPHSANLDVWTSNIRPIQGRKHGPRPIVPSSVAPASGPRRVDWLDGVRGAAALFVVLHHMWHLTWHDYPYNGGPWALGWLLYAHLAVAVFIVVSGFSLALSPVANGDKLMGGVKRFIRRRTWRIVPAYWAALLVSVAIYALYLNPDTSAGTMARSVVVHGLLIQDIVPSVDPNGAFWSIAVEWQIYFLFPVILLLARWRGFVFAVAATTAVVVAAHLIARLDSPLYRIDHVSPQFLALFAFGVLAAKWGHGTITPSKRRAMAGFAIATGVALVVLANTAGSAWIVARYFWVDLIFGAAVACMLTLLFTGSAAPVRNALKSRGALFIGGFSYSLYLIHGPLVKAFDKALVSPLGLSSLEQFAVLVAFGVPVILGLCYGFHLLFEKPFLRYRSFRALRELPPVRALLRLRRPRRAPAEPAEAPVSA